MKFYVKEKLGLKQSLTPEGFLLCEEVPINRTGVMLYGPGETPVEVGQDGIAHIEREADEVFRTETIASANGKPVVDEHPDQDVDPRNWNELARGVVFNPRRGSGANDDVVVADLLITSSGMIQEVRDGKREVSCGYDADYEQIAPGRGRQKNIVINHVALVDSGRCGSRCAIGDSSKEVRRMSWYQKMRAALKKGDTAAATAVLDEIPDPDEESNEKGNNHIHVHVADSVRVKDKEKEDEEEEGKKTKDTIKDSVFSDKRFTDLSADVKTIKDHVMKDKDKEDEEEEEKTKNKDKEKEDEEEKTKDNEKLDALEIEAPPGTGDKARKARDSAYLEDSFQETVALAEIIAPGIGVPTFDRKLDPKKTYDAMCKFRRSVLTQAHTQPELLVYMDGLLGGRTLDSCGCTRVRDMFVAVGNFKKALNSSNLRSNDGRPITGGLVAPTGSVRSLADINKKNAEFYK